MFGLGALRQQFGYEFGATVGIGCCTSDTDGMAFPLKDRDRRGSTRQPEHAEQGVGSPSSKG